jgi:hypothetical protein
MAEVNYATDGKANAALTTGIIGTTLGGIAAAGGLGAILGIQPGGMNPSDRPVTRYEMDLIRENARLQNENTRISCNSYTDHAVAGVQRQIDGQSAVNAAMTATMQAQQGQINQIMGITRLVVPNENVAPGWGRAAVTPAPPWPPVPWWPPVPPYPPTGEGGTQTGGDTAATSAA